MRVACPRFWEGSNKLQEGDILGWIELAEKYEPEQNQEVELLAETTPETFLNLHKFMLAFATGLE